ncbi:MAG: GNAT family N-acetyltransferase [Dehalococcoidales bacterium]|nr:GNAT family N-acetyltransferase [Dehalococcoidales bacterium]
MLIRKATLEDIAYIESLRRKESEAIGFIPKLRYEMEINGERHGSVLVIEEDGELVGFVYATHGNITTHIQQIAIQEDARRMDRASALVEYLMQASPLIQVSCRCAQDLESNEFWKALGFNLVGVIDSKSMYSVGKDKRSRRGRQLNIFCKAVNGLWLPGSLGEQSIKLKPIIYPRTLANSGGSKDGN